MAAANDRVEIIEKILADKISKREVVTSLNQLEKKYGEKAYSDDGFEPKEKPWDREYFKKMERMSLSGVSSKRYILQLVEVRDYLKMKKMMVLGAALGILIIISAIILYWRM